MDGRQANGGAREGAGRKPKAFEDDIKAKLQPMDDSALEALKNGISQGDFQYVKLFMEYRYGKPKETKAIDLTNDGKPFNLRELIEFE